MEKIEKLIGLKVRDARKKANLSQKQLAKNAKCSLTTINRLEKGRQFPHSDTLKEIAEQLNLSYTDLFLDKIPKQEHVNTDRSKSDLILEIQSRLTTLDYDELDDVLTYVTALVDESAPSSRSKATSTK